MQSTKIYNESNVLKAWAYIYQNSVIKRRQGIITVQDRNEMVQLVLSDAELQRVLKSKFVCYNPHGEYYELNRHTYYKAHPKNSTANQPELFD